MKPHEYLCSTLLSICAMWLSPAVCRAQEKQVDNGTDPSKLLSTAEAKYEYLDLGDLSLQLAHVFGLTRKHAFVLQAQAIFDTAARPELGTGKNVLKGTHIYAKFLPGGNIFAPALVQSNSLGGQDGLADVNTTTLDFYFVPKLADARNLVTFDPVVNFDCENHLQSGVWSLDTSLSAFEV